MAGSSVLTIMFTDLVASTEQSHRLGEDAADELRRTHFSLLRNAVRAHGGEEVKNTGDGLMVVFPLPSEATACAVAMQQTIDNHNRRGTHPLGLRIGLHTGEVTCEDDDYFGTPVVVAERLCHKADGGQIIASDVVRALAAGRGHTFLDVGPLALKGIPEPMPAVDVAWEPAERQAVPLPRPLASETATAYVGRVTELEKLRQALKSAREGQRELVFLVGEPGIGKSRLASEFSLEAHADGATVLYGRCDEEAVVPYQPFAEALGQYAEALGPAALATQIGPVAGDLVRLVPDLASRLPRISQPRPSADPDADRLRMFDGVTATLAEASGSGPVLLVLDDLHWADRSTLHLMRHLLRAQPFPLLVLATYRETDLDRAHPLATTLADLRRELTFERLHLRGLRTEEIAEALEKMAGHTIGGRGRALAEVLRGVTDGNPFFIEQIVGHLVDTGGLYQRDGTWTFDVDVSELGIPEGVKEVIGRRLSQLSEETNRVLAVAAVIGRDFSFDILEAVSGDTSLDALDRAVALGIVEEVADRPGSYRFTHALVRETLYEELTATRRVRLHRQVARVLDEIAGTDEDRYTSELAHHLLEAAQVAEVDKAVAVAGRAARHALDRLAYEQAARLYERAIGALELKESADDPLRCDLLLGFGEAQAKVGGGGASRETFMEAFELARRIDSPTRLARAALGYSGNPEFMSIPPEYLEASVLTEALERLGEADRGLRVSVSVRLAAALVPLPDRVEESEHLAERALAEARAIGDPSLLGTTLHAYAVVMSFPSANFEEGFANAIEFTRLGEDAGDRELEYNGRFWTVLFRFGAGENEAAEQELARVAAIADELKQINLQFSVAWVRATMAMQAGHFEEAEQLIHSYSERFGHQPYFPTIFGIHQIMLLWHRGRLDEFEPTLRSIIEQAPDPDTVIAWRFSHCFVLSEIGRLDEARVAFDRLSHEQLLRLGPLARLFAVFRASLTCAALGYSERAEPLYELLTPYDGRNLVLGPAMSSAGATARYLGLLAATMGDEARAEAHFVDALELNERIGARPFLAATQHDYARLLLSRGDPSDRDKARELLDAALATAREIGMKGLEEKVDALRSG